MIFPSGRDCKFTAILEISKKILIFDFRKNADDMHNLLIFQNIGAGEIIIIALVILLLFGGRKIPELMRGLGKGVKSFKAGMNEVDDQISEIKKDIEAPADKTEKKD